MRGPSVPALYDPRFEHDACGVGFIAQLGSSGCTTDGYPRGLRASREVVEKGLTALERMEHRGATGADEKAGDGAGILVQIPHELLAREAALGRVTAPDGTERIELPEPGGYGVGSFFRSTNKEGADLARALFSMIVRQEGQRVIGWRRVPTDARALGRAAREVEPRMDHVVVAPPSHAQPSEAARAAFDRKLYVIRKRFEDEIRRSSLEDKSSFYLSSLSSRTLVYKGMLTPAQVRGYFADLSDPHIVSAYAIFHSRFSTNTFPSWALAHPYRMLAHNGEINTLRGNINFMRAREALLASPLFGDDIAKILPVVHQGLSDSACLDSVLELLVMAGRSLPHALMMLIPEAWERHATMSAEKKAFYAYHSCLVEPWDGPACVTATDGRHLAAVLDRNGLRPARYAITKSGFVALASEVGVFDLDEADIIEKGRVGPGRLFVVDLVAGRVVPDAEIKEEIVNEQPYGEWLRDQLVHMDSLPEAEIPPPLDGDELRRSQAAFGITEEERKLILLPMATRGEEALGSMGNDAALAVLSKKPRRLYDYFQQLFAQVTNPPLDAIREELLTSVATVIGPEGNILESTPESCHLVLAKSPFLDEHGMARLRKLEVFADDDEQSNDAAFAVTYLEMLFPAADGPEGLEPALMSFFAKADVAIENGAKVLVLSDRGVDEKRAPIPALLAVAGLHNHLVLAKNRTRVTLIVETGDATEVHHYAALLGYGASAIHPYLALDSLGDLSGDFLGDTPPSGAAAEAPLTVSRSDLQKRYLKAVEKGVVKIMSKMGISTIASYRGAQIFEAVGLASALIDRHFTHTPSRIGGLTIRDVARDVLANHHAAFKTGTRLPMLESGGHYQWRRDGEAHLFSPETVWKLQHATRQKRFDIFEDYTSKVNEQASARVTLRSLLGFQEANENALPLEAIEPASDIVKRFATGAMSYGSISREAHETLAIAMNRIGGRSNSGEGGEAEDRAIPDANGDSRRSRVKQVASGRFGVTSAYLVSADEIQIKIAQGAKPGEGGQLPGNKVYPWIAEVRHATPGVGLISPPPHHDIYSIEDLAQLIFDLKNANPHARVSVKLVAEVGIGTVAAGVAKAKADVILVSGHDGGTGASPLTSLKHAGVPWELGLAEVQQTLVMNGLRDRVVLQVDGQMKTGRDVIVGTLLGAEEFGFATAPLVVMGCVMMRVCHLDTCPVGIATQNPALRKHFEGRAEHVVSFFEFVAEEVRGYLARLGARSLDEIIGRVDLLKALPKGDDPKLHGVVLDAILDSRHVAPTTPRKNAIPQRHGLEETLDVKLIEAARPALERERVRVTGRFDIQNRDRATGTMLGSEVTRAVGPRGLPDDTISFAFRGSAGQSFGAFVPSGVTLHLEGEANDYLGKGLSGGTLVLVPARESKLRAEENVIAGNVVLYGATSGRVFIRGKVGERFAVRNSGAHVVVEGTGDHGCEYMTGGVAVILGPTGRNFAAGMSGGMAYVRTERSAFEKLANAEMVDVESLDERDIELVEGLLREHLRLTQSELARRILAEEEDLQSFLKVIPREYRRVMQSGPPLPLPAQRLETTPTAAE